ncbi:SDR family NAD(P)-dependent oxidoreductase [Brevundimonas sp. GCM10030266]|uniref:SDR family NAD(P)-dependent oxidoreductase n=1 Tax=Brevundimonas sp. GCM10030266 TaxID=3273386 RepID=UPI00361D7289
MEQRSLKDRVIVVTGAGRGLGLAYALDLASRGAKVVVNTRPRASGQPASAESVVERIRAMGGEAVACPLAVEQDDAGERLLDAALSAFGRIDGLVNNAGAPEAKSLHKQTMAELRAVFDINYFGTVSATLPIYRHMRDQGAGRIVITTSAAGLHGVHGMAAYSSSKAALIGLMRVIALEGASKGVHANAVAPYALTGMTEAYVTDEVGSAMPPEYVAPVVSWLMSEACPLNGETLVAGAGKVRRAVRIEGPGVQFQPPGEVSPDDLTAAMGALMSLEDWTLPTDGNQAFEAFLKARPATAVRLQ